MPELLSPVISIGGVAEAMGVTPNAVRKWEATGVIPPALRIEPGSRRVYLSSDLEAIRQRVEAKRAATRQRGGQELVAS